RLWQPHAFGPDNNSYARRSPSSVSHGSTRSMLGQYGAITSARPPVATTSGSSVPGHSALIRLTRPSTASIEPSSTPARMHSSVRVPITLAGITSSVSGSFDVLVYNVSADDRTPGAITPPRNTPSFVMQS